MSESFTREDAKLYGILPYLEYFMSNGMIPLPRWRLAA